MATKFAPTDCASCRASIYQKLNRITAVSILAFPCGYDEVRAWAYVGHLAREIQGDLLRMAGAEAEVITKALTPVQRPWRRNCEGEDFTGREGA